MMTKPDHDNLPDAALDALIDAALTDDSRPFAALEARIMADAAAQTPTQKTPVTPIGLAAFLGASMAAGLALGLFLPSDSLPNLQTQPTNTAEVLAFADGFQEVYYDN